MTRIGWIGCGNHASEMLLPRLDVRLKAVCDVDPALLALIGDRCGVATRCTDDGVACAYCCLMPLTWRLGRHGTRFSPKRLSRADCRCSSRSRRHPRGRRHDGLRKRRVGLGW
jgi:hypothetical protein